MRLLLVRPAEIACREVVELIDEHLDGSLSRRERRRLEGHLAGCEHCSEYLRQMHATIELSGTLRVSDLSPAMRRELLDLYRRWRAAI